MTEKFEEITLSAPMQRVLDALLAGQAAPPEAQAALSPQEQSEVAALARTAHLTRLALNAPQPAEDREETSLAKAQAALATRPTVPASPDGEGNSGIFHAWRDRWRRRNNGS